MCDYCGCRSRALLAKLGEDHARLALQCHRLLVAIAAGDVDAAADAVAVLAGQLRPHSALEEAGLYQELRAAGIETGGLFEDHARVDAAVAAAVRGDPGAWAGLPAALSELQAHIDREEYDLFPAAHQLLDDPAWDRLDASR
jgi:hypothetical protein